MALPVFRRRSSFSVGVRIRPLLRPYRFPDNLLVVHTGYTDANVVAVQVEHGVQCRPVRVRVDDGRRLDRLGWAAGTPAIDCLELELGAVLAICLECGHTHVKAGRCLIGYGVCGQRCGNAIICFTRWPALDAIAAAPLGGRANAGPYAFVVANPGGTLLAVLARFAINDQGGGPVLNRPFLFR